MRTALVLALLSTAAVLPASLAVAQDGWHLKSATTIDGKASGWDYVSFDAAANHVFLGHRKEGLQVFDPATHTVVKVIDGTAEASSNGAVIIPDLDLGLSNNENGTIIPFKLSTLDAKPPVKVGEDLDTSHFDPVGKRLVVNLAGGKDGTDLVMLDPTTMKDVGHLHVPSHKVEGADSDGTAFFLAAQDLDKIYKMDTAGSKVLAEIDVATLCGQPTSIAADVADDRVFVGCRGRGTVKPSLIVLDGAKGSVVYSAEIGAGTDSLAYDPTLKRIFSTNGLGANLNVFAQQDADTYKPEETLGTRAFVRTMAMDHKTGTIYAVTAEGSADPTKKILTSVSPFYPNTFYPNTFTVLAYGKN
ncbi:YncE family protein [Lichenihabitans psoromatis]|uniref:YncE family protein n=1 Tax=Lichenihabitans psoromatis TaxID=2528642 RepID=UPI0010384AC4|nr:WD40 repeat domain-containing protein [Lichenihabitans psoromatis]